MAFTEAEFNTIQTVLEGVKMLPQSNQTFAASLCDQAQVKGWLSQKQWDWMKKFEGYIVSNSIPDFTKGLENLLADLNMQLPAQKPGHDKPKAHNPILNLTMTAKHGG